MQPPSVGDQPLTTEQIQTLLDELLKRTNVLPGQTPAWEQVSGVPVGVDVGVSVGGISSSALNSGRLLVLL